MLESIVSIFNQTFNSTENTRVLSGCDEPIYIPARFPTLELEPKYQPFADTLLHTVVFANDSLSSFLHEVAHWFIAGENRRCKLDYGYWYAPDGRDEAQQKRFESVEVKPQALEWILADTINHPFSVSADNLKMNNKINPQFLENIILEKQRYLSHGLPKRAAIFHNLLTTGTGTILSQ